MYLMKLRYGDKFASNAGCAWRQLLVLAIFPWMSKYRLFKDERQTSAEDEADEIEEEEELDDDPLEGARKMKDNVVGIGGIVAGDVGEIGQELYGAGGDIVTGVGNVGRKVFSG